MFSYSTVLTLGLALLPRALAANDTCEESWMFIDIHYRQVDARPDTFSYGLFIGVGANSQNQSLWPSVVYNETRIASNDFCGSATPPAHCNDPRYTHGHYGADVSTTWQKSPQYSSLDTQSSTLNYNVTYGQDQLNLFTHYFDPSPASNHPLPDHPITVLSDATSLDDVFFDSGTLGLGPSSTVIKQLIDQGRIDRNVVSMYLGTAYPRAGGTQNGSVVIGGYDAGRFTGTPHQYPFSQTTSPWASPLKVHVKQLSLVTSDGTTIPFVTDDGFDGHISTHQYPMDLPHDIIKALSTAIAASPANNDENSLSATQPFSGNLTITLDDGYEITFPPEWITNASNVTPFSATTLDTDNTTIGMSRPLIFGAAFLHHLYMTIDYDASTFYLVDAKVYDNYVQPQPLCASQIPIAMSKPRMNRFLQSGMIGAILGGIIGGSAVICIIILYLRKRAQYRQSKGGSSTSVDKMEGGGATTGPRRKSSMRKRSMFGFGAGSRGSKDVTFGDVKRVSISDSEPDVSSPPMAGKKKGGGTVSVSVSVSTPKELYEMSRLDGAQPGNNTTTTNPNRQPIQSPLPTPFTATTPHTSNPLLPRSNGPNTPAYTQFNDRDDSDIPADFRQPQPQHIRQLSDSSRNRLGLTVDTTMQSGSVGVGTRKLAQGQTKAKQKVPLTLNLRASGDRTAKGVQSSSRGKQDTDTRREGLGFLRKVFPAS